MTFQWKIYELTVVSVMWMHEFERCFEWHELIKLCHTRLYALAATLRKCSLIRNAAHCWMHCMYTTKSLSKTVKTNESGARKKAMNEKNKNERECTLFQEFTRIACKRRAQFFFSFLLPSSLSTHSIFYLSHLLLWYFLHSVWKFHFVWLHEQKLFCKMSSRTAMHTALFFSISVGMVYSSLHTRCCRIRDMLFAVVLNECGFFFHSRNTTSTCGSSGIILDVKYNFNYVFFFSSFLTSIATSLTPSRFSKPWLVKWI